MAIPRVRCVKWLTFHNKSVHNFCMICGACYQDFLSTIFRMNWGLLAGGIYIMV